MYVLCDVLMVRMAQKNSCSGEGMHLVVDFGYIWKLRGIRLLYEVSSTSTVGSELIHQPTKLQITIWTLATIYHGQYSQTIRKVCLTISSRVSV